MKTYSYTIRKVNFLSFVHEIVMDSQENRNQFYITLPASASSEEFPNNTNSEFKVRLPQRIRLELGQWDVTLSSIHLPNRFHNITIGSITLKGSIDGKEFTKYISIGKGWIKYPSTIIRCLNDLLAKETISNVQLQELVSLKLNLISSTTQITVDERVTSVEFSQDLQDCLGVNKSNSSGISEGNRPADVMRGLAYMYSDVRNKGAALISHYRNMPF